MRNGIQKKKIWKKKKQGSPLGPQGVQPRPQKPQKTKGKEKKKKKKKNRHEKVTAAPDTGEKHGIDSPSEPMEGTSIQTSTLQL